MSIKYNSDRTLLSDIIIKASRNAVYLIPDLQRPYVWTPKQVILLMDSLFRGWPFGSLLVWKVDKDCYSDNEGIPHREFWEIVDRTDQSGGSKITKMEQPSDYYMVLDGQQRIQSLLLALGGDAWGFKLYDHDWSLDLNDRRMKNGQHWSKGTLCLDLEEFQRELDNKANKVRKIEVGKILAWVVNDSINGQSNKKKPGNYEDPLPKVGNYPGRFLRLSRLWDLVEKDLSESEYREKLEPFLQENGLGGERVRMMQQPLAEFLKIVEQVKSNSYVHSLQIESFRISPQWTKDDYNAAIVTIFTRLNTAGRTLTQEEITLAWLKVGWNDTQTGGRSAGDCLSDLLNVMAALDIQTTMDELVRLLSFLWAVESSERRGELLEAKDLLKGEIIRPMAAEISKNWNQISEFIAIASDVLKKRDLISNSGSFNAIIVCWTWFYLAKKWVQGLVGLKVSEKDAFEKGINDLFYQFQDRWLFSTQWANVWAINAVKNFQKYGKTLHDGYQRVKESTTQDRAFDEIKRTSVDLLNLVETEAIDFINKLSVLDRTKVSQYRSLLWVWHRIESMRWKMSDVPMRITTKRGTLGKASLEVDHTIADAFWRKWVDAQLAKEGPTKAPQKGLDGALFEPGPANFVTKKDTIEFINTLGNCYLLEKSFNISKNDRTLWSFLSEVYEIKNGQIKRDEWEKAMGMDPFMTDPPIDDFQGVVNKIQSRDKSIREDLIKFVKGQLSRQDI